MMSMGSTTDFWSMYNISKVMRMEIKGTKDRSQLHRAHYSRQHTILQGENRVK